MHTNWPLETDERIVGLSDFMGFENFTSNLNSSNAMLQLQKKFLFASTIGNHKCVVEFFL